MTMFRSEPSVLSGGVLERERREAEGRLKLNVVVFREGKCPRYSPRGGHAGLKRLRALFAPKNGRKIGGGEGTPPEVRRRPIPCDITAQY